VKTVKSGATTALPQRQQERLVPNVIAESEVVLVALASETEFAEVPCSMGNCEIQGGGGPQHHKASAVNITVWVEELHAPVVGDLDDVGRRPSGR
jgi:hypothetical protein